MKLFFDILVLVLFTFVYIIRILHFTHMFQLNAYRTEVQLRWMGKNKKEFCKTTFLFLLGIGLLFLPAEDGIIAGALSLVLLLSGILNIPSKAKKRLIYTKRVKRLLVTNALLLLALLFCIVFAWKDTLPRGLTLLSALILSPLALLLCNGINLPLEGAIHRYYIRDAKRILRSHPRLITVGVTGSYGKTSVKYMLGTLLEAKYHTLITPESYNTPMGVTKVIRSSLRATHEVFVCEMGAKYVGDIRELCELVHPKHGIITSVGPQHLESFHSLENVQRTKFELADALPEGGMLFLNGEDANIQAHAQDRAAIRYGFSPDCDYYADALQVTSSGTSFLVHHKEEAVRFEVSLIGAHNVLNLVGAIAVCCELGIRLEKLPPYARKLKAVAHRLQLTKHGRLTVIDDAYNSNPSGARAAIDALALFSGKKIVVTPGMVELGAVEYEENYKFGAYMADVCDHVVLVGKKQTEAICNGLKSRGFPEAHIDIASDVTSGIRLAFRLWQDEERIVLLENDLPDNY